MIISKIFIDMDGVLADFDKKKEELKKIHPKMSLNDNEFWKGIQSVDHFFLHLEPMPDMSELMSYLQSLDIPLAILTALPRTTSMPTAKQDKKTWIGREVSFDIEFNASRSAKLKQKWAREGHVLIDDKASNIDEWRNAGGIGIFHVDAKTTISKLKQHLEG